MTVKMVESLMEGAPGLPLRLLVSRPAIKMAPPASVTTFEHDGKVGMTGHVEAPAKSLMEDMPRFSVKQIESGSAIKSTKVKASAPVIVPPPQESLCVESSESGSAVKSTKVKASAPVLAPPPQGSLCVESSAGMSKLGTIEKPVVRLDTPIEKIVYKDRVLEVPVEVIREVPVEIIREVPVEVTREVARDYPIEVIREVPVTKEVPVEKKVFVPVQMAHETIHHPFANHSMPLSPLPTIKVVPSLAHQENTPSFMQPYVQDKVQQFQPNYASQQSPQHDGNSFQQHHPGRSPTIRLRKDLNDRPVEVVHEAFDPMIYQNSPEMHFSTIQTVKSPSLAVYPSLISMEPSQSYVQAYERNNRSQQLSRPEKNGLQYPPRSPTIRLKNAFDLDERPVEIDRTYHSPPPSQLSNNGILESHFSSLYSAQHEQSSNIK